MINFNNLKMKDITGPIAYIHTSRLKNNISEIKNHVGDKKVMVVVKANGYGHGAINIASNLSKKPYVIFCVFSISEAIQLRENGIKNDILIFSKLQIDCIQKAIDNNLWINASEMNDLVLLADFYKKNKICPKIHLEFDTGMTRSGFNMHEDKIIFDYIMKNPFLPIEGIYSHFSTADEGDLSYAYHQLQEFNRIIKKAKKSLLNFKYIHCSNSGSILNLPNSYFNTIRIGMLTYGVAPSNEVAMHINVKPVMSFCGPIVSVRKVEANTSVSYGGIYKTKKSTHIAVVQTGFADGIPRGWYKEGYISYKGKHYKIAGRICMDQFMVDFGKTVPTVGDEVLIFGKKGVDQIPIERIADKIDTTSYSLLTAISGRTEYVVV